MFSPDPKPIAGRREPSSNAKKKLQLMERLVTNLGAISEKDKSSRLDQDKEVILQMYETTIDKITSLKEQIDNKYEDLKKNRLVKLLGFREMRAKELEEKINRFDKTKHL